MLVFKSNIVEGFFMITKATTREFDGDKYRINLNINAENSSYSMIFNHITDNATVLDVGCACGDLGVVLKNLKNAEMYGLEYNKKSIEIAKKTGAYKEIVHFDLDQINEDSLPQYRSKFDFIICGDILEHLRDPKFSLNILKSYLKPKGFILASIPNIGHMSVIANLLINDFTYTPIGLLDETHIHFFTYKSIVRDTCDLNLKVEECDFTMYSKTGSQPINPYPLLPIDIQKFLFKNYHFYVCQYVVKMSVSTDSQESLLENNFNKLNINEWTAPFYILNYRKQLLEELFLSDL